MRFARRSTVESATARASLRLTRGTQTRALRRLGATGDERSETPVLLVVLCALTLFLASCRGTDDEPAEAAVMPAEQTVERGPVRLSVRLDRGQLVVGEPLTLTIEVTAENGVDVAMPEVADQLGPFEVRSARTPPDVPVEAGRLWTHRFTLETYETGDLEIPALTAIFSDRRAGDGSEDVITGEVATAVMPVRVDSVMEGDDLTAAVDIEDAVPVPVERPLSLLPLLLAASMPIVGIVIAIVAIMWTLRRRAGALAAPAPPPHVWALEALDALQAQRLVEDGRVHEFYVGLTGIVRSYIERRFEVSAPERTTDEFLREVQDHPVLGGGHREALRGFLRSADMVKFARYRPETAEIDEASTSARRFVIETAETPDTATAEVAA